MVFFRRRSMRVWSTAGVTSEKALLSQPSVVKRWSADVFAVPGGVSVGALVVVSSFVFLPVLFSQIDEIHGDMRLHGFAFHLVVSDGDVLERKDCFIVSCCLK